MEIIGKITGIKYTPKLIPKLQVFNFDSFDINELPSASIIIYDEFSFGLSKWVSPKRTRSYPYARVYDTLGTSKRITVIPIIKDEGKAGDRDFIQWDTIALMSLLDVFVVFAYYETAEVSSRNSRKITNQRFNNEWIKSKIIEIRNYHSSALHWNIEQIKMTLPILISRVKDAYKEISKSLNIELHSNEGIEKFEKQFINNVEDFMKTSRQKAEKAQQRESLTRQPKERLETLTKAKITIENYLGGKYYFTTDEIMIKEDKIFLIEAKHTEKGQLPKKGDIKDGLVKMILYSNLHSVMVDNVKYNVIPVLKLTSDKLVGSLSSLDNDIETVGFFEKNVLSSNEKKMIEELFSEARENNFIVKILSTND